MVAVIVITQLYKLDVIQCVMINNRLRFEPF